MDDILFITSHIDMSIEYNRIRLGVCPHGIASSKFITYYHKHNNDSLTYALQECVEWVKENLED